MRYYSEMANLVFIKVDDNIFEVKKDKMDEYSGTKYVSNEQVIDSLNNSLKVAILSITGMLIHANF